MEIMKINDSPIATVDQVEEETSSEHFITANTKRISYKELRNKCVIPVFAKDNESTISHPEFISSVQSVVREAYSGERVLEPCIRVSHPIKGRVPEAMGKAANQLTEHEKTVYYDRMGFFIDIPDIKESINENSLSLTVGGVRAYNLENLYSRKMEERFKVFVGFKNHVCCNLCIWTDGYSADIRARSLSELMERIYQMITGFNADRQLGMLRTLSGYSISESEFAKMIGRARMYNYLPAKAKKDIPSIQLGDAQVNAVVKDYYQDDSFCRDENGNINLWNLYNLFTSAIKSSYLDTFLDRNVGSTNFISSMAESIQNKSEFWYLS